MCGQKGNDMTDFRIELAACEMTLLNEIAMKEIKRDSLALTYSMAIVSSEQNIIDWGKINKAIIERWSFSGLEYIKNKAWKLIEEKNKTKG